MGYSEWWLLYDWEDWQCPRLQSMAVDELAGEESRGAGGLYQSSVRCWRGRGPWMATERRARRAAAPRRMKRCEQNCENSRPRLRRRYKIATLQSAKRAAEHEQELLRANNELLTQDIENLQRQLSDSTGWLSSLTASSGDQTGQLSTGDAAHEAAGRAPERDRSAGGTERESRDLNSVLASMRARLHRIAS